MLLGVFTSWVGKNPDEKGCAETHCVCSLVPLKRPKGPGGAYDQVLGRNQPCLTGKGM